MSATNVVHDMMPSRLNATKTLSFSLRRCVLILFVVHRFGNSMESSSVQKGRAGEL